MSTPRATRFTRLLVGLQVLLATALVSSAVFNVYSLRQEALDAYLAQAVSHARVFEDQFTQTLDLSGVVLRGLPEVVDPAVPKAADSAALDTVQRRLLFLRSLSLAGPDGRITASSNHANLGRKIDPLAFQPEGGGIEPADYLRVGQPWFGRDFADGRPGTGKADEAAGLGSFLPVLRETQAAGQRHYLLAAINPDYFLNHIARHVDATLFEVQIVDYQGRMVLSTDEHEVPGQSWGDTATLRLMREREVGTSSDFVEDGRASLTAFRASRNYPFFVLVHVDRQNALGAWASDARYTLLGTAVALIALLTVSTMLVLRVRRSLAAEAGLQAELRLSAQVFDHSTNGIIVTDASCRILAVNPQLERISGYSAEELIGQNPHIFASGRHQAAFYEAMWQSLREHQLWRGEIVNRRKDGRLVEEWLTISVVRDGRGGVANYLGVFEDVTAERQQGIRLQRQLDALRALNDISSRTGLSPEETLHEALRVAREHLHLEYGLFGELLGEREGDSAWRVRASCGADPSVCVGSLLPPSDNCCAAVVAADRIYAVADAGDAPLHLGGRPLTACLGMPVRVNGELRGALVFASGQARDHQFDPSDLEFVRLLARWAGAFTERLLGMEALRRAQQAAEQASAAKGNFLANMSHEIRTPMNGVLGMADLLLAGELSPEQRDHADTIRRSAEALLGLINDILDFSKVEAGKLSLDVQPFSPADVLDDIVGLLRLQAAQKDLALLADCAPEVPASLLGDAGRLRQILINLAGNAVKFTAVGEVRLSMALDAAPEEPGMVRLRCMVSDTGIGMAPAVVEQLFSPFYQGDASTTRQFGGSGLGLSICKRLAELMGGRIEVVSTPGLGSTFCCVLPFRVAADPVVAPVAAGPAPTAVRPGLRLLLVEDNPINRKVAEALLRKVEAAVVVAENGAQALEKLAAERFDAVLMDCQMPVMDGFEATRRLRAGEAGEAALGVPVIAMTANAMQGDRERCLEAGMNDYLAKPVNLAGLQAVLGRQCPPSGT